MEAEDSFGATSVPENPNYKADPGQEGSSQKLSSEVETANIQHIHQTTQAQAATCEN